MENQEIDRCAPGCSERLVPTGERYFTADGTYEVLRCPRGHGEYFVAGGILMVLPGPGAPAPLGKGRRLVSAASAAA